MIYVTSDLHFGHNKEFLFKPRGFDAIEEHDRTIIANWNSAVTENDVVYILGDLTLGDLDYGISCIRQLKGNFYIILGNHDTDNRIEAYRQLPNVLGISYAMPLKYNKYRFFLTHYPTITSCDEKAKQSLKKCLINLYGHTHQKTNFYNGIPYMYHVGLDSHNNTPVSLEQIIADCEEMAAEYRK